MDPSKRIASLSGKCLLVIEDDPTSAKLIRVLLRPEGCHVEVARDAAAALRLLLANLDVSLMLIDLQLPDIDGLQLTRFLKACPATRDLPIVAMSASGPEYSETAARAAGCDAFISKPIDGDQLVATLAAHLDGRDS